MKESMLKEIYSQAAKAAFVVRLLGVMVWPSHLINSGCGTSGAPRNSKTRSFIEDRKENCNVNESE